jgi:predicted phage terminase large subunit-like protein
MTAVAWKALAAEVDADPDFFIDERDRRRLSFFARRMFPGYQSAAHIARLIDHLEWAARTPNARLIVTMPPRSSKSLHVSELFPAWYLGNHPNERIIAASHSASLAYTFSRRVRNLFDHPRWPFPAVTVAGDKAAVQAWDIEGTRGGYLAIGVGGSPTGSGSDLMLVDDPLRSAADADSATTRESLWEWWTGTMRTRLEPGAKVILTATRWHDDDLTGRLLQEQERGGEQWTHLHLPAIDDDGNALWPERWPLAALLQTKAAIGSRAWQSQYQGDPQPAEGGMFKRHWWGRYTEPPRIERAELVLDSAFKEGVGADYSALALWGTDGRGSAYLLNAWRDRVEFPGLLRLCRDAYAWSSARYPGLPLVIEDKASGQSAIQVLRRADGPHPALPIVAYAPPGNVSKIARAEAITGLVEGGRVFVPEYAPWLEDWLAEHERFPTGAHDDYVDTSAMAIDRLLLNPSGTFEAVPDDLAGQLAGLGL